MSGLKRRRRKARPWQPDGGRLLCSDCGKPSILAPGKGQDWPASPCCGAAARPGPQRRYLVDLGHVTEVLNAGSIGSGKTDPGLMGMVVYPEYRLNPTFSGLVLRHWQRGQESAKRALQDFYTRIQHPAYYPAYVGGSLNIGDGVYRFARGGSVQFTHSAALRTLQGPQFQSVLWEEITHWDKPDDYLWVSFSRLRSPSKDVPIRIRATTNAGGPGAWWVKARWGPWLASDYLDTGPDGRDLYAGAASLRELGYRPRFGPDGARLPPLQSGEVLGFITDEQGRDTWCRPDAQGAFTRSCLRSQTADNVVLSAGDEGYSRRARAVAGIRRGAAIHAQQARDDWDVSTTDGELFKREWFEIVDAAPHLDGVVRVWDLAYTAPDNAAQRRKRDYTVGAKVGWVGPPTDRTWYVLHLVRDKKNTAEVRTLVQQTAAADGRGVPIIVPVDYAAGSYVSADLSAALAGYVVTARRQQGKKEVRIGSLAPQAQAGRVRLLKGGWNHEFLDEAAAYPDGRWDDQLDAVAEGFLWSLEGQGPTAAEVDRDVDAWGEAARMMSGGGGREAPISPRSRDTWDAGGGRDPFGGLGGIGRVF